MKSILIADGDTATRKALALLITRRLHIQNIEEAADTGTLIHSLEKAQPDLLILDWSIHGVPGRATSVLLRNTYPNLKIILLSLDPEDGSAAHSAGVGFICKGASPEETLSTLAAYLEE